MCRDPLAGPMFVTSSASFTFHLTKSHNWLWLIQDGKFQLCRAVFENAYSTDCTVQTWGQIHLNAFKYK